MKKYKKFIEEASKMKGKDPCWKDYEMVGTKKKNGKEVPNCVPKEEYIPEEKHPALKRAGVSGFSKPKKTPGHPTKSHVVVVKDGSNVKTIRFGQQGVSGAGDSPSTDKEKARQRSFKARHSKNIAKGKTSAAYWADKVKW